MSFTKKFTIVILTMVLIINLFVTLLWSVGSDRASARNAWLKLNPEYKHLSQDEWTILYVHNLLPVRHIEKGDSNK